MLANQGTRADASRDAIPAQLRFKVLQRDGFRCAYCGRSARDGTVLHIDHVVPVAAGGETTEDNLLTACSSCNLGKSAAPVI
jgi:5-methylcytosine-specific restriction endonuclease McrA